METAWPHLFISTDCHARINIAPSSLFRQAGHWDRKPERATFHVDHVTGIDQWDGRPHSAFGQTLVVRTDPKMTLTGSDRAAIRATGPLECVHPKDRLELSVEVQGASERLAKGETNGRVGKVTAAAPRSGRG